MPVWLRKLVLAGHNWTLCGGWQNIFAGSHTEHCWRCSKGTKKPACWMTTLPVLFIMGMTMMSILNQCGNI
jgi:hypothetical protein